MTDATARWAQLVADRALGADAGEEPDRAELRAASNPPPPEWARKTAAQALGGNDVPDTPPAA
jgi:hypothetical protein